MLEGTVLRQNVRGPALELCASLARVGLRKAALLEVVGGRGRAEREEGFYGVQGADASRHCERRSGMVGRGEGRHNRLSDEVWLGVG